MRDEFAPLVLASLLLLISSALASAEPAVAPCNDETPEEVVRIGVSFRSDDNGSESLFSQVQRSLQELESEGVARPGRFCVAAYPYPTEERGSRGLKALRESGEVDLVIGPTDSGVYQDALRDEAAFAKARLPVVSPLVAADFEGRSDWLFKTNADVLTRTESMMNLLRSRGARSVGVLYEDSVFAMSAETAFRRFSHELDWYQAARFSDEADLASAIDVLLEERPVAIGILASRHRIHWVHEIVNAKNSGLNPYRPFTFTIIDVRSERIPGLDFVSVGTREEAETSVLVKTTMRQVVRVLNEVGEVRGGPRAAPSEGDGWPEDVRDGLSGVLDLSPQGITGQRHLLAWQGGPDGGVVDVQALGSGGVIGRLLQRPSILLRRYGALPIVNLCVVIGLVVLLTRRDLLKWTDEREIDPDTRKAMRRVVTFNVAVALGVYFLMLTIGTMEWSSFASAVVVGVGYPAILKSTLARTRTGEAVGAADWYDEVLRKLNDKIMLTRFHSQRAIVEYIAMTNSPLEMRDTLVALYRFNSEARQRELIGAMEREVAAARDSLEIRKVYARRIQRTHEWKDLVNARFVLNVGEEAELIGPEEILQAAVEYCEASPEITVAKLRDDFEQRIKERALIDPERAAADRKEVQSWLKFAQTEAGDMRCYLRWLFMQVRYRVPRIIDDGYLPEVALEWTKEDWGKLSVRAEKAKKEERAPAEGEEEAAS